MIRKKASLFIAAAVSMGLLLMSPAVSADPAAESNIEDPASPSDMNEGSLSGATEAVAEVPPAEDTGAGGTRGDQTDSLASGAEEPAFALLGSPKSAGVTVTIHWTSIDGQDLMDPIVVPGVTAAHDYVELGDLKDRMRELGLDPEAPFSKAGYEPQSQFPYHFSPYSEGVSDLDFYNTGLYGYSSVYDTVYFMMLKEIDTTIDCSLASPPVCGTETKSRQSSMPWNGCSNPPELSISSDDRFSLDDHPYWCESASVTWKPFEGSFEGGKDYFINASIRARLGYCFSEDTSVTSSNTTVVSSGVYVENIPLVLKVTADHIPGEPVEKDRKEPTCTAEGSFKRVTSCTECGTELSSETIPIDALGHEFGGWEVTREATATEDGEKARTCGRCKETETMVIPASGSSSTTSSTPSSTPETASFTITYKLNGGTYNGITEDITETHEEGSVITIMNAPTREGYKFSFWKGSEYQPGDSYTVTGDHTFNAVWEKESGGGNGSGTNGGGSGNGKGSSGTKTSSSKVPATGENTNALLWGLLLAAAVVAIIIALFSGRKKR